MGSITPFLVSIVFIAGLLIVYHLFKKKKIKSALFVSLLMLAFLAGLGRFQPLTDKYRANKEQLTFDRHYSTDTENSVEKKDVYEDRMNEKHEGLRDESEDLLNRYLGEEK